MCLSAFVVGGLVPVEATTYFCTDSMFTGDDLLLHLLEVPRRGCSLSRRQTAAQTNDQGSTKTNKTQKSKQTTYGYVLFFVFVELFVRT